MNSNNTFCQSNSSNSNNACTGYSSYWRQFESKPTTSSGYGYSSSSSSSSNFWSYGSGSSNTNSYHVPSFCQNSNTGLKVW